MSFPEEIITGHGCSFHKQGWNEKWTGEKFDAVYEGRVAWADSDCWEYPDWVYEFMKELRAQYPDKKIATERGDKGYMLIYFF